MSEQALYTSSFTRTQQYREKRQQDIIKCNNMNKFLDYMYRLYDIPFKRINNIELQHAGIDIKFGAAQKNVDEKVATDYYYKDLGTYSFELASANNKNHLGWFHSERNMQTTDYMICWVRADNDNNCLRRITSLDCCLVNKAKLWDAIKAETGYHGATDMLDDFMKRGTLRLRDSARGIQHTKRLRINGDYTVVQSLGLSESPINLLISKNKLHEIAGQNVFRLESGRYEIQSDGLVYCNPHLSLEEKIQSFDSKLDGADNNHHSDINISDR